MDNWAWAKQGMGQTGHGPNRAWAKQGIGHLARSRSRRVGIGHWAFNIIEFLR